MLAAFGCLAQLEEQLVYTEKVGGSIPSVTNAYLAQLVELQFCKLRVGGSSPSVGSFKKQQRRSSW